jgi:hypothetical protein
MIMEQFYRPGTPKAKLSVSKSQFLESFAFLSIPRVEVAARYNFRFKIYFPTHPGGNRVQHQ